MGEQITLEWSPTLYNGPLPPTPCSHKDKDKDKNKNKDKNTDTDTDTDRQRQRQMIQFYAKSKGRDTLIIRPFLPSANIRHIPIGWRKLLPFGHLSNKTADKKTFVLNWP